MPPADAHPKIAVAGLTGLWPIARDAQEFLEERLEELLPTLSRLIGQSDHKTRSDLLGVRLLPTTRMQGECVFRSRGPQCEIRLYEGLLLFVRCMAHFLSTQIALTNTVSMPWARGPEIAHQVLERFVWMRDDLLGETDLRTHEFRAGRARPLLELLGDLALAPVSSKQLGLGHHLLWCGSVFALSHEIGHYMARVTGTTIDPLADSSEYSGAYPWQLAPTVRQEWPEAWWHEITADRLAIDLLSTAEDSFGDRTNKLNRGQTSGLAPDRALGASAALGSPFLLACLHAMELFSWLRLGTTHVCSEHPPAAIRYGSIRTRLGLPSTPAPNQLADRIWVEVTSLLKLLFYFLKDRGDLALDQSELELALEYFERRPV